MLPRKPINGFTLIELVVAVGVSMLLVGGAIAGYTSFNDRQTIVQSAKQFGSIVRLAQKRAAVGDKQGLNCSSSERLVSYSVVATSGQNTYTLRATCERAGNNDDTDDVQTYTMLGNAIFTDNVNIIFDSPSGKAGNISGGSTTFQIGESGNDEYVDITVTSTGSVTVSDYYQP